jgi:hypothetical protein
VGVGQVVAVGPLVLTSALATPASRSATPTRAVLATVTKTRPMPMLTTISAGSTCRG